MSPRSILTLSLLFGALVLLGACSPRPAPPEALGGGAAAPAPVAEPPPAVVPATAPAAAAPAPPADPAAQAEEAAKLAEAAALVDAGRQVEARLAYQRLLHRFPDSLGGQSALVELLLADEDVAGSIGYLRDRLEAGGRSAGPLFALAYGVARQGTLEGFAEARTLLTEARRLRPDLALITLTLAEVRAAQGDQEPAAALYAEALPALRRDGDWEREGPALLRRGQLLQLAGKPEAQPAFREAVSRSQERKDAGQEALARNGLGAWLASQGRMDEADAEFAAAATVAEAGGDLDGAAASLRNRARLAEERWQDGKAIGFLQQVVEKLDAAKRPLDAAGARLQAGELLARVGRLPEALTALQAAVEVFEREERYPLVAEALSAMARALWRNERREEGLAAYQQVLALRDELAPLLDDYRPLAETLLELGEAEAKVGLPEAVEHLERALALAEKAEERRMTLRCARALAKALLQRPDLATAPQIVARIEALGGSAPYLRALLALRTGEVDEAVRQGERALDPGEQRSPEDWAERMGLLLHLYLGRDGEGDLRQAFGLAAAGRSVESLRLLERLRVRLERGAAPALLAEGREIEAQEQGMRRIIDGASSPAVAQAWEQRLGLLQVRRRAWREKLGLQAPAYAAWVLPEVARAQAQRLRLPAGQGLILPQISSDGAVVFLLLGDRLQRFDVEGQPDRDRLVEIFAQIRRDHAAAADPLYLLPPPGLQTFDWGLPLLAALPTPALPLPAAAPAPEPLVLPLLEPLPALLGRDDLAGRELRVELDSGLLERHPEAALELLLRAGFYLGAARAKVQISGGPTLLYLPLAGSAS